MVHGMLVSLPPWVRVAVLATACAIILLAVGILAWLLSPACLGRLVWCRKRRREQQLDNTAPLESKPKYSIDEELELGDVTYRSWARGSLYDSSALEPAGPGERDAVSLRDSTYSSMSDTSSIASVASGALDAAEAPPPSFPPAALEGPPCASLRLQFLDGLGSGSGRLGVAVLEARALPARDYGCSPDPSVQVGVARRPCSAWPWSSRHRPRPMHLLRTRTLRHARHPHYNEDFAVEARKADMKDWVLEVSVLDDCRLRGPSALCSGEVRLRAHWSPLCSGEPLQLNVPLQPGSGTRKESRGLLLFGLSYLPTSQRLSITIIKACRLRVQHVVPGVQHLRPYVRATLVQASSGRRVQSVRTDPQDPCHQASKAASPEFCETLCLKLPPAQLSSLSLVVALCHRLPESDSALGQQPHQPQAPAPRARDRVVGAIALGGRVESDRGREHWRAMEQRPRRVISVWHTLT